MKLFGDYSLEDMELTIEVNKIANKFNYKVCEVEDRRHVSRLTIEFEKIQKKEPETVMFVTE